MIHYLSKYKSPKLFTGCYCEIKLSENKNFNERTVGQLVGKSGERKEEFFSLSGVKPHIEYSDDKPNLILSKYNPREVKLANMLGERFQTTKSWSSNSINKHFKQLQERLSWEEKELGQKILEEYWPEQANSNLAELIGRMSNERYSPSQTLLEHSLELASEAKKLAEALALEPLKLQRMALFHDIGKVIMPYYQHTSPKVIESIPELNSEPELAEIILSHHNPLGSFTSPYIALITLLNRVHSQAHFMPPTISQAFSSTLQEEMHKILETKIQEKKITNFYLLSSLAFFWFILKCPIEYQDTLTQELTTEFNALMQNYLNSKEETIPKELKHLNISIFWLPLEESEDKLTFTRLKLLNSIQVDSETL